MDYYEFTAILVLAVIPIIIAYAVIVVVRDILRERRRARLPKPQITHPELGVLIFEESLWSGSITGPDGELEIYIGGDEAGPDAQLVENLRSTLQNLPTFRAAALDYIFHGDPENEVHDWSPPVDPSMFRLENIGLLWEAKPRHFCMGFELKGDFDGIWRVEFEDGRPVYSARDD